MIWKLASAGSDPCAGLWSSEWTQSPSCPLGMVNKRPKIPLHLFLSEVSIQFLCFLLRIWVFGNPDAELPCLLRWLYATLWRGEALKLIRGSDAIVLSPWGKLFLSLFLPLSIWSTPPQIREAGSTLLSGHSLDSWVRTFHGLNLVSN